LLLHGAHEVAEVLGIHFLAIAVHFRARAIVLELEAELLLLGALALVEIPEAHAFEHAAERFVEG